MSTIAPEKTSVSVTAGRSEITMETGHPASRPTAPPIVLRSGDTMILAATGRLEAREGADFFPLTVDVEERMYAAGDPRRLLQARGTPDREGDPHRPHDRPPDPAALAEGLPQRGAGHLHDTLRPTSSRPTTSCINGASAALMISPLPFQGPVGAVRIGLIDGEPRRRTRRFPRPRTRSGPHRRGHEGVA